MALVESALGRSDAVVLAGAMGVGKSALLAAVVEGLEAAGRPTVVVRATRSTASIPFGAFARWVPDHLAAAGHWLGVLRGTAAALGDGGDGVVVAVDDAQLLDDASAALVLHLAQHTAVGVLVTVRSGDDESCPDAVETLGRDGVGVRLDVGPLSEDDTIELAERMLGGIVAPEARRRLWQLTAGNPLYLGEVVDAVRAKGVLVQATSGASEWAWDGPLAGPGRLIELVTQRLAGGGPDERRALELIALAEPMPVELLTELAPLTLLADIETRGMVVTEQPAGGRGVAGGEIGELGEDVGHDGPVVRLAHPLYAEVVRSSLPPFTARARLRDLVEAALATGLHRRDALRVATWMLDAGEGHSDAGEAGDAGDNSDDFGQPQLLLRAAEVAHFLDDLALSARLAEAAERAGAGPHAQVVRAQVLGQLGRFAEAEAMLRDLSGPDHEPEVRAVALAATADLAFWDRGLDLGVVRRMLRDGVEGLPAEVRPSLLVQEARLAISAFDLEAAYRAALDAAVAAETPHDRLHALTTAGLAATFLGSTGVAMYLIQALRPYALAVAETDPVPGSFLALAYAFASVFDGRIDESAAIFAVLVDHRVVGAYGQMQGYPTWCFARVLMHQGKVATATRLLRGVLDQVTDHTHFSRGNWMASSLAQAAGQAGDDEALAHAVSWLDDHRVVGEPDHVVVRLGQAWWRASTGELSSARELARESAAYAAKTGATVFELLALLDIARLGDPASVVSRLDELTTVVDGPYAQAVARFAVALATDDGARLDAVADRFAAMGARLLEAEAAAAAAGAHRRRGRRRDEAASLARAQQLVTECEAAETPLLAGLRQEPVAASLTRREREVAELAARGRTSREIAEALSVSLRTVHSHLDHAYTKLGITSRRELPAALGIAEE
jgi:DNA-binding CsgD family transcriptional regulator